MIINPKISLGNHIAPSFGEGEAVVTFRHLVSLSLNIPPKLDTVSYRIKFESLYLWTFVIQV